MAPERRRISLRARVTLAATAVLVAVLSATGAGLVVLQRRQLLEDRDDALEAGADAIEAAVVDGQRPAALGGFGDDDTAAQVVLGDEVLASTPNLTAATPIAPRPPGPDDAWGSSVVEVDGEEESLRVLSRAVAAPSGDDVVIHVAGSLDDVDESTAALVAALLAGVPVAAALLAAATWWGAGRTLAPVDAIRAEVERIGAEDLRRRVPEPGTGDEIDRLARTMNAMLGRVETAVDRQQRFVADASHELRTPLARLRTQLEVDLAHPATADPAAAQREALEDVAGLEALVDDLLLLARRDAGALPRGHELVDLDELVGRAAAELRASARVDVDARGIAAVQVRADRVQLARAIGNVVDNAARHAERAVTLAAAPVGDRAVVTVDDDGPGVPAADRERIFERFTRLDEARSGGGTGLGLAIAREVVARHGGTIEARERPGGGTRIVVSLPAEPA